MKVYATLSSGMMTLFAVKRDGKSKVRAFALYGSAIGLVESNLVTGNKHCFRVLDGIETIVLQASSHDCMMEWSTSLAHSISMENGGGILLDKEKRALAQDGFGLDSAGFPIQSNATTSSVFRGVENEDVTKSIIFANPIKELCLGPESGEVTRLEPITEKMDPVKLNTTHATEATDEVNTTFNSLDPADISHSMEDFARNFFVIQEAPMSRMTTNGLPIQTLRTEATQPWLTIDRVSSTSSGSEIFDKASDFDESVHINPEDFQKLLHFTKEVASNGNHEG